MMDGDLSFDHADPPTSVGPAPAREVTFVVDTSGSMAGGSIEQAKESLVRALDRLRPKDSVNLIRFASETRTLFPKPMPATAETVEAVRRAVLALEAEGGTEMLGAVEAALSTGGQSPDLIRQVVFLTDGSIGDEDRLFRAIETGRGDARVHMVGIGSAPNAFFVNRAAEVGRGSATIIGSLAEVGARMQALFQRLENPAVTDLKVSWPDGTAVEAWPNPRPDLHLGETLVVSAKTDRPSGEITVSGRRGTTLWTASLPLDQAAVGQGVEDMGTAEDRSLETLHARGLPERDVLDGEIWTLP